MKKITTLLCGVAMAAALAAPVHAGGKSTTGSSATVPASVLAALQVYFNGAVVGAELGADGDYVVTLRDGRSFSIASGFVAHLVSAF